jgi:hypothetical protein
VHHTINCNDFIGVLIKDGVRESPYEGAPKILKDERMGFRGRANSLDTGVNAAQEVLPKTHALSFVPGIGFIEVLFGFLANDQFSGHAGSEYAV